jgi:hypothetical protein
VKGDGLSRTPSCHRGAVLCVSVKHQPRSSPADIAHAPCGTAVQGAWLKRQSKAPSSGREGTSHRHTHACKATDTDARHRRMSIQSSLTRPVRKREGLLPLPPQQQQQHRLNSTAATKVQSQACPVPLNSPNNDSSTTGFSSLLERFSAAAQHTAGRQACRRCLGLPDAHTHVCPSNKSGNTAATQHASRQGLTLP